MVFLKKIRNAYKIILLFCVSFSVTTIFFLIFSVYFLFQYSLDMEKRIVSHAYKDVDIFHLCQESNCKGVYQNGKFYDIDENTYLINAYKHNTKIPKLIFKYKNVSLRNDLSILIRIIHPDDNKNISYYSINITKFKKILLLLYIILLFMCGTYTITIVYIFLSKQKILNGIELSNDKSSLQFDNLMFYIENLNHEVNSPLFVLSRKLKELKNKLHGYENTFEILFNSVEQISAVMQRTRDVKKINKISEDRTIYDLIERTVATISIMRAEELRCETNLRLNNYYLDQDLMSNGTFINILTNHIKNSIEAFADVIISDFVSEKKNKLTFTFTDNGNGIAPEHRKFVFDKGFSTKSDKNNIRGSGLAINKFIIESTGGSIKLNDINNGTQFEITIPVKKK